METSPRWKFVLAEKGNGYGKIMTGRLRGGGPATEKDLLGGKKHIPRKVVDWVGNDQHDERAALTSAKTQ